MELAWAYQYLNVVDWYTFLTTLKFKWRVAVQYLVGVICFHNKVTVDSVILVAYDDIPHAIPQLLHCNT